jgi:acylphosphatase
MNKSGSSQTRLIRVRLVISGRVQGVYFRASAREMAYTQRVSGWVRNRLNGDVEAVVEGEEDAVQAFIAWCHSGPSGAHVCTVQATMEPYTGEFRGFRVVG